MVLVGALIGGVAGYFLFFWIAGQGLYCLVLPGALVGVGAGFFRNRFLWPAIVCGLVALGLGLFTEWQFAPFKADHSLGYFITHIHELEPITLIMIAGGGLIGFAGPYSRWRREREAGGRPFAKG